MRFLLSVGSCVLVILILCGPVRAQGKVEVDWREGIVTAVSLGFSKTGIGDARGKMMAQRAARLMALRDIAEFMQGVHVSSETTVEDAMMVGDVVQARVQSVIKQAHQVGDTQFDASDMATVVMQVKFEGNMENVLMPHPGLGTSSGATQTVVETPLQTASSNHVTGLGIDARGLNLVSAMVPKILLEDGQIVYGPGQVNRESAVQNGGLVAYEKDIETAYRNDRVGKSPLTVKAVSGDRDYGHR